MNKKKKGLADKILAIWMFVLGVHIFLYYLFYIEYYNIFPHFMGVAQPVPMLHGPLLLLYIQALIYPNARISKTHLLHFIPPLLFYILIFPDAFLTTGPELLKFAFETLQTDPPLYWGIFMILNQISGAVYVVWSLIILKKHRKNIANNFSYIEKINLDWLVKLIIGMAVIWAVVLIVQLDDYIYIAATAFVFLIGYFGSRQGAIFTDNSAVTNISKSDADKYRKSSLTSDQSRQYLDALQKLIEEEKPYLETKITLKDISERLGVHPNHLSQIINEQLKVNFYDFINQYRVEEFKKRLTEDTTKKFTLLAHAYDSGFSSKSSFNEVFKKFTGLTPSQYQKEAIS
ncbi:MAG: helix-turn-helix domain-containing protein [Ekhidna sp.]